MTTPDLPPLETRPDASADAPTGGAAAGTAGQFMPLSPRLLVLWRIWWVLAGIVLVLVAVLIGVAAVDLPKTLRIALAPVLAAGWTALVVTVPSAAYRRWRYAVTADGIELRHGLIVHQQSSIPHFRVQHVDIRRGVIQRWLGIVSLTISTASPATDAELPGLDPDQAEHIRRRVLDRVEADDGV